VKTDGILPGLGKHNVVARVMALAAAGCCWPGKTEAEDHGCDMLIEVQVRVANNVVISNDLRWILEGLHYAANCRACLDF
jgi:hypothetical protein